MKDQDHYSLDATVRFSSGTNIARCNGFTASSTASDRIAAENAAQKSFECMCRLLKTDASKYLRGSIPKAGGIYEVNFTRVP